MNRVIIIFILILINGLTFGQNTPVFTKQDSLRGTITPERSWWDLKHYDLRVKVNPETKMLSGVNIIRYEVLKPNQIMQIDLQEPMVISAIQMGKKSLKFRRQGMIHYIELEKEQKVGEENEIQVFYEGKPVESKNPPWSGGMVWREHADGEAFIATACQGDGASLWWPCKEHGYDEPDDGMMIRVNVPKGLLDVSNGRLEKVEKHKNNTITYHWKVVNPINNYGVNLNIANYAHFSEKYKGKKGILDCNYYVLPENLEKAKVQFKQVPLMLEAFEHWFGPYPFYEDGFKLVETPYLGMEHQSSVTYGNGYKNGYRGRDLSQTGEGLKFDFIIIHESGHEWFANNITNKDVADMWIHEGFTAYSEALYLEYHYGKESGYKYIRGTRSMIQNDRPIIGIYDVNHEGSGDMYYKGSNLLHTLRQTINDDDKWLEILRGLNETFYHKTVSSEEVENYIISKIERKNQYIKPFFNQYLRDTRIPVLEYRFMPKGGVAYRWANVIHDFTMPVDVKINGKDYRIRPTASWSVLRDTPVSDKNVLVVDKNYYVGSLNILGE